MTFNPYRDQEEFQNQREKNFTSTLSKGAALAGSVAGGPSILKRLVPLLSSHVPDNIAMKGIQKVSPRLGNFVESATNFGYDFYSVRDFLRAKAAEEEERTQKETEEKEEPKENRNIIQQYSPALHEFIKGEIGKGKTPLEAGALAQLNDSYKNIIKKISTDHSTPFSAILDSTYGSSQKEAPSSGGPTPSPSGTAGGGKAALVQTMQEITNALKQLRGNG